MSIQYDGGGDPHLLKLAAARVVACDKMPYVATALFAMVPVRVEGLGTFASDNKWRLYWDPEKVDQWDVNELAGVLLHEVGHCLRGHADRFTAMGEPPVRARVFNVAGDSLINEDLREARVSLPGGCVFIEHIKDADKSMSAEQVYRLLIEQAESNCTCGSSGDTSTTQNDDAQQGSADTDATDSNDSHESDDSGNAENSGGSDQCGDGSDESSADNSAAGPNAANPGQGSPSGDGSCPVHGNGGLMDQGWDCGSGADGIRRAYEAAGEDIDPGVDEDRADLLRQQTAVAVAEHSRNRGNVPSSMERWAKELLHPTVDWRKELATLVRRRFATVAGRRDYTYQRPSRRQAAMTATKQNILLPAMRQPAPPQVSIVIDTSGSMSDDMLTWAVSETQGIIANIGSRGRSVRLYSCDAAAGDGQRITNISQVQLRGGGGTDMRVGIQAAYEDKPTPEVIILITDGFTPYPSEPIPGVELIVALTTEASRDSVPPWARTLVISQ